MKDCRVTLAEDERAALGRLVRRVNGFTAAGQEPAYTGGVIRRPRPPNGRRRLLKGGLAMAGVGLMAGCGLPPLLPRLSGRDRRIGYVRAEAPPEGDIEGFRRGLREHGYEEGRNLAVEYRWADGDADRLRAAVDELIGLGVDLIVASAPEATRVAKEATATIPIVMVLVADPVTFGFVDSLARPGGNVTGFAFLLPELSGKRLELLTQAVPGLRRAAVLWYAGNQYKPLDLREVQLVARAHSVDLDLFPVGDPNEFGPAFGAAAGGAGGLITLEDPFTIAHRARIVELALRHRLPAVYAVRPFVEAGGLMFYGPDRVDQNRRAAAFVDKILKGARPADLPVERPTKFDFVVNLATARAIGLTIPDAVLEQASELIQ